MLRDLTIQNYRTFKDFKIDGLARVNLIVGRNNSGKTSLLEAIYLLVNQVNGQCLIEWKQYQPNAFITTSNPNLFFTTSNPSLFLTTSNLNFEQMAVFWDGITLTPKEESVVAALQILEPNIERISFTSRQTATSGILLKVRGQREPIPLGSMGEGMRRILSLAMASVTVENGVLLVDEIENGLYYETQTDMWRLILEIAQRLNVQVFATTHSWDCVSAFQEALAKSEDSEVGKLFRLSMRKENIRPVAYTADDLAIAVRQSIEVR